MTKPQRVFVTDFDGTMTELDFYSLVVERLLPGNMPNYWIDYRNGTRTHFEALQAYFAAIRADEGRALALLDAMELDRDVKASVDALAKLGWKTVVASAGCDWYIKILLDRADVDLELHANPGRFENGRGLQMELPQSSPFFSPMHGIRKSGIVEHYLASGAVVAFAGDGYPDIDAAKLVPDRLRFARRDLAEALTSQGYSYRSYDRWSEIAQRLLEESESL